MPKAIETISSITTAIPSGPVNPPGIGVSDYKGPKWCIEGLIDIFGNDTPPYTYNECANSTLAEKKSDFESICCDGSIIDTTFNIWGGSRDKFSEYQLDIQNLVCCRAGGQRIMGGIQGIDNDYTHCSASYVPTPLASLAATNTENAALYTVIYESASGQSDGSWGDWTRTETPTCLWVQTTGVQSVAPLETITVEAAQITTLPPPSTDHWGQTIDPSIGSKSAASTTRAASSSTGTPLASQSTSHANRSFGLSTAITTIFLPLFVLIGSQYNL